MSASEPTRRTITGQVVGEIDVKKSRFVCVADPADSLEAVSDVIEAARKKHWSARHHCHAAVLGSHGETQRSSDDGEPAGTAGVPMLTVLNQRELSNVVVVVSRYFGGIKLGAGGLIRAYTAAVVATLNDAVVAESKPMTRAAISAPLDVAGRVEAALRSWFAAHSGWCDPPFYTDELVMEVCVPSVDFEQMHSAVAQAARGKERVSVFEQFLAEIPIAT